MYRTILCAAAGAIIFAMPAKAQEVDPLIGTWKINFDKSTMAPPPPKSLISTVSKEGDHYIAVTDLVRADGQTFRTVFQLIYDGQPHPTTGFPNYDASAYTRIGNTINGVRFKQGKAVEVTQTIIYPGKTWTVTAEGIAANGEPYHFVLVYDRQ
jgi:hypothetical protein